MATVCRDEVRLAKQFVELDQPVAQPRHGLRVRDRIRDQHVHAEAQAALGHRAADAAESDHPHRRLVELAVEEGAPAAGPHPAVVLDDAVRRGTHQGQGVVRHGLVVGTERHRHRDPMAGGRRHVDHVVADTDAGDHLEAGRGREHPLGVGLDPRHGGDDAVQRLDQLGLGQVAAALVPAHLDTGLRQRRQQRAVGRQHRRRAQHRPGPGRRHAAQLAHIGLDAVGRAGFLEPLRMRRLAVRRQGRLAGEHLREHQHARLVLGGHQLEAQAVALGRQRVADVPSRQLQHRLLVPRVEAQLGDDGDRLAGVAGRGRHLLIRLGPARFSAASPKPNPSPGASDAPAPRYRGRRRRSPHHPARSSGPAGRRSRDSR